MRSVLVVGLGGITCSYKSTLAKNIKSILNEEYKNVKIEIIHQDDYFLPLDQVPPAPDLGHYNYECPESMRLDDLTRDLKKLIDGGSNDENSMKTVIIVEGIMMFCHEPLRRLLDQRYFTFGTYEECKRIRSNRTDYVPPDVPGYLDAYVWPYAVQYENEARQLANHTNIRFLPMRAYQSNLTTISMGIRKWMGRDWLLLKNDKLDLQATVEFVTEPSDGAVAVFCGITRDTFQGKTVLQLEYEAYDAMAYAEMRKLCNLVRNKWSTVDRMAIHHRLGVVPVTETSVIITISSPHRKDAQEACAFSIDHLKAHVPIWKKERYSDGTCTWKENPECRVFGN